MGDRIMSRPLDPGADANWDNTFGTRARSQYVPPEDAIAAPKRTFGKQMARGTYGGIVEYVPVKKRLP